MADAAKRLIDIMKKVNTDTVSDIVCLTVQSTQPLVLYANDKLLLTKEFVIFDSYIDTTKLTVGDKFKAVSLSGNQIYYIVDIISSDKELDKYIQRIKRIENRLDM